MNPGFHAAVFIMLENGRRIREQAAEQARKTTQRLRAQHNKKTASSKAIPTITITERK